METLENRLCRILSEEVVRTLERRLQFREILNRPHLNRGESVEERIRHLAKRRVHLLLSGTESHDVGGVHEVSLVRINGVDVGHIRDRAHHHAQLEKIQVIRREIERIRIANNLRFNVFCLRFFSHSPDPQGKLTGTVNVITQIPINKTSRKVMAFPLIFLVETFA